MKYLELGTNSGSEAQERSMDQMTDQAEDWPPLR